MDVEHILVDPSPFYCPICGSRMALADSKNLSTCPKCVRAYKVTYVYGEVPLKMEEIVV